MKIKSDRPNIAISSCLLGEPVRYNGFHTQDRWITSILSKHVNLIPICPEIEMGLGTPREEIYLEYSNTNKSEFKLKTKRSNKDLTNLAKSTYSNIINDKRLENLDGFIFMRKSPSCGLGNVKSISNKKESSVRLVQGLFAKEISNRWPLLPKEDSGRFKNVELKEKFIKQVFAHFRLRNITKNVASIQDFHKKYKYILMEHSQRELKALGNLAANHDQLEDEEVYELYQSLFLNTISNQPTTGNRINTFQHIFGYLKRELNTADKLRVLNTFDDYKQGHCNYLVPLRILDYLIRQNNVQYLMDHFYFTPYPKELNLAKSI